MIRHVVCCKRAYPNQRTQTKEAMKTTRNRFRQVSLMSFFVATLLCGVFAAGFKDGFAKGTAERGFDDFDSLIALIQSTVVPDIWETLDGSTLEPYEPNVTSGCLVVVVDNMPDAESNVSDPDLDDAGLDSFPVGQ